MKKTFCRILSVLLIMAIFLSCSSAAFAAQSSVFMSAIEDVMDTFQKSDLSASNINHQILNGRYRTVQMLEVIAYENLP